MHSSIVLKYLILKLWKEKKHFRENLLIFLWIWGETELISRIVGANEKYIQGAEEFSFQGFGEINALFSGIKEAQTPWGPR